MFCKFSHILDKYHLNNKCITCFAREIPFTQRTFDIRAIHENMITKFGISVITLAASVLI